MGSLVFTAAARSVWNVSKGQDDPNRRLFLPIKMNLAPDTSGLAFSVVDGCIVWEADPVTMTADDLFAQEADAQQGSRTADWEEAANWLADVLTDGALPTADVKSLARKNGIGEKSLRTAREQLQVVSQREGFGRGSRVLWAKPDAPIHARDSHTCPHPEAGIYGGSGHVCERDEDSF